MQPDSTPTPPGNNRGIWLPMLINAGLVLVLAALAYTGHSHNEALVVIALLMAALAVVNVVALVIAALARKWQWVAGFALSVGLLLLVGLGTCGLAVNGG